MKEFKPLKELVRALTYIGDAIAGNVKTNATNSKEYDGMEVVPYSSEPTFITFGLNVDENINFSKLGDVFSDNAINDINYIRKTYKTNNIYITRKYDIRYEADSTAGIEFGVNDPNLTMTYYYYSFEGDEKNVTFEIELSALSDDLTKDTLLTNVSDDEI